MRVSQHYVKGNLNYVTLDPAVCSVAFLFILSEKKKKSSPNYNGNIGNNVNNEAVQGINIFHSSQLAKICYEISL